MGFAPESTRRWGDHVKSGHSWRLKWKPTQVAGHGRGCPRPPPRSRVPPTRADQASTRAYPACYVLRSKVSGPL